jgi:hypothetical protein
MRGGLLGLLIRGLKSFSLVAFQCVVFCFFFSRDDIWCFLVIFSMSTPHCVFMDISAPCVAVLILPSMRVLYVLLSVLESPH